MKAIQVRYLAPTTTKGARVKAWIEGGKAKTVSQDDAITDNMLYVAELLADELNWLRGQNELVGGTLPNGDMCFVLVRK